MAVPLKTPDRKDVSHLQFNIHYEVEDLEAFSAFVVSVREISKRIVIEIVEPCWLFQIDLSHEFTNDYLLIHDLTRSITWIKLRGSGITRIPEELSLLENLDICVLEDVTLDVFPESLLTDLPTCSFYVVGYDYAKDEKIRAFIEAYKAVCVEQGQKVRLLYEN